MIPCRILVSLPFLISPVLAGNLHRQVSIEPWDVAPTMTASLSPGYQAVVQGATVVTTITMADKDTFHVHNVKTGVDTYPQAAPLQPDIVTTLNSMVSPNSENTSLTSSGDGTWVVTHTHTARSVPSGESFHIYVDEYSVQDNHSAYPVLKDPTINLSAQVRINPS